MNEFQPLMDQIFREKVERARRQTVGERMSDSLELCDLSYGHDDEELRRRVAIIKALQERDIYGPPEPRL